MSARDVCIKAGSFCPVCRGMGGVDCWHEAGEFHAGSAYLDKLLKANAALAASEARVKELEAGIVHRGDDVIMPEHLYIEINASGAHWKARAEAAEQSLAEARKDAERLAALSHRLRHAFDYMDPIDPEYAQSEAWGIADAIDALLPKAEGATS